MAKAKAPAEPKKLLPQQVLALTRATSDKLVKAARSEVSEGEKYPVDFGVRVQGELIVNHGSAFTANVVPKPLELVQCLLAEFGPRKRKQVVERIVAAGLAKAIAQDGDGLDPNLPILAQQLIDGLTTTATASRRGSVTGAVELSVVEWSL